MIEPTGAAGEAGERVTRRDVPRWRRYLRIWGPNPAADIEDELAFHLEMRTRALMARGLSGAEARAEAGRAFGDFSYIRQELEYMDERYHRRDRQLRFLDELRSDLLVGARSIRSRPIVAAVILLTLTLGIGANTAVFSVVHALLLRPLPFAQAEQLLQVHTRFGSMNIEFGAISEPEYLDLQQRARVLEAVAVYSNTALTLTNAGEPERLRVVASTASLWGTLGARPSIGRVYTPDEDRPGQGRVVVLSHGFWLRRFGGERSVIGRSLTLNGDPYVVIGVSEPEFIFGQSDLYVPIGLNRDSLGNRSGHYLQGVGRMREGVSVEAARKELAALTQSLRQEFPQNYPAGMDFSLAARPLHEAYVGQTRPALQVLAAAVIMVLLITCANIANLYFAQGESRRREFATRTALGGRRARLVRQLVTESLLLALVGGALGVLLAHAGIKALLAAYPNVVPRIHPVGINGMVLLGALIATTFTALVSGLAPAWRAASVHPRAALQEDSRTSTAGRARTRLRGALVTVEVALAMSVLVGAGLLLRSLQRLNQVAAGFDAKGVLTMDLRLSQRDYGDSLQAINFYGTLLDQVTALPGVQSAGAIANLPLRGGINNWDIEVEGRARREGEAWPSPVNHIVTSAFFRAFGVAVRAGRAFDARDRGGAPLVTVVNESFARMFWPGGPSATAVGKRVRFTGDPPAPWLTVVGVVEDMKVQGLHAPAPAQMYFTHAQSWDITRFSWRAMTLVARTTADPMTLAGPVRAAVARLDPRLALANVEPMEQVVRTFDAQRRVTTLLLSLFAVLACGIAIAGVYGLMAFAAAQRRGELAVRMAFGATSAQVGRELVRQAAVLAGIGVVAGSAGAVAIARLMRTMLFETATIEPVTYLAAAVILSAAAVASALLPALRAARTQPMEVLRQ